MTIGKQIRKLRRDKDFTQKDIYDKTGIHQETQSDIETGKNLRPTAITIDKLIEPYKEDGWELQYIDGEFCIVKKGA